LCISAYEQSVCQMVSRMLTPELCSVHKFLKNFSKDTDVTQQKIISQLVIRDETWIHHFDSESEQQSMQCNECDFITLRNSRFLHFVCKLDWAVFYIPANTVYRLYGRQFYRSKDPTNSNKDWRKCYKGQIKQRKQQKRIIDKNDIHKISTTSPLVYTNMGWLADSSHRGQGRPDGGGAAAAVPPFFVCK